MKSRSDTVPEGTARPVADLVQATVRVDVKVDRTPVTARLQVIGRTEGTRGATGLRAETAPRDVRMPRDVTVPRDAMMRPDGTMLRDAKVLLDARIDIPVRLGIARKTARDIRAAPVVKGPRALQAVTAVTIGATATGASGVLAVKGLEQNAVTVRRVMRLTGVVPQGGIAPAGRAPVVMVFVVMVPVVMIPGAAMVAVMVAVTVRAERTLVALVMWHARPGPGTVIDRVVTSPVPVLAVVAVLAAPKGIAGMTARGRTEVSGQRSARIALDMPVPATHGMPRARVPLIVRSVKATLLEEISRPLRGTAVTVAGNGPALDMTGSGMAGRMGTAPTHATPGAPVTASARLTANVGSTATTVLTPVGVLTAVDDPMIVSAASIEAIDHRAATNPNAFRHRRSQSRSCRRI